MAARFLSSGLRMVRHTATARPLAASSFKSSPSSTIRSVPARQFASHSQTKRTTDPKPDDALLSFISNAGKSRKGLLALAGLVAGAGVMALVTQDSRRAEAEENVALSQKDYKTFTLEDVVSLSDDTSMFRFALEHPTQLLGMTVASCLTIRAEINGEEVTRPYTPVSDRDTPGHVDLLIKMYATGKMGQYLKNLKPGDSIEMKGPWKKIDYKPNMKKTISMIAGGSGITPMYQVIREIVKNPEDKTEVYLLFANRSEEDILLRNELDELQKTDSRIHIFYTVDHTNNIFWKGGRGFITKQMASNFLPPPSDNTLVLVCGPPPMVKHICGPKGKKNTQGDVTGLLKQLGYDESNVFKF